MIVLHPAYLIGASLLLGYLASGAAILLARWIGKREERHLVMLLAVIVVAVGCAAALNLSVMLSLLAFGVGSRNLDRNHHIMQVNISQVGQIFFVVLFVVTGATLDVGSLVAGGAIAVVYVMARFIGKAVGVLSLAHFSGTRAGAGGLLCLTLTPMSSFAIEMTHGTARIYPEFAATLAPMVLSAVLIMELIGPLAVQFALRKAGEAQEDTR
jgi:Kef-type K+ transport system membrane component KefB